jgi:hypothetical protein
LGQRAGFPAVGSPEVTIAVIADAKIVQQEIGAHMATALRPRQSFQPHAIRSRIGSVPGFRKKVHFLAEKS